MDILCLVSIVGYFSVSDFPHFSPILQINKGENGRKEGRKERRKEGRKEGKKQY